MNPLFPWMPFEESSAFVSMSLCKRCRAQEKTAPFQGSSHLLHAKQFGKGICQYWSCLGIGRIRSYIYLTTLMSTYCIYNTLNWKGTWVPFYERKVAWFYHILSDLLKIIFVPSPGILLLLKNKFNTKGKPFFVTFIRNFSYWTIFRRHYRGKFDIKHYSLRNVKSNLSKYFFCDWT